MPQVTVTKGDITTVAVDAIVNAANSALRGGGGVDGAIHAAGGPTILDECQRWVAAHGHLPTGEAMITGAGRLPADHVIHTVGPIYREHDHHKAARLLGKCYTNSLHIASEHGCRSLAFPNISTGIYGYPKKDAASVAVTTVREWTSDHESPEEVLFVCFDETNYELYRELLGS